MRVSSAWLREWVNPPLTTAALAERLTLAGLEVAAVAAVAPAFSGVVVGQVRQVAPHPDATKLRVCQVSVGADEPLCIVCGAANVAAGMKVPVAVVGARLPDARAIAAATLRGVSSAGMICSAAELGLAERSEGIWPLPADAPVGTSLRTWLQLDDETFELELTPDRGDCLSIAGVAREVAALTGMTVTPPSVSPVAPLSDDTWPVEVSASAACPRYACRLLRGLDPHAETPLWLRERLRRSGLRPLGPVVDVTNYVLLEWGQPMHAFDAQRISGTIRVRWAAEGEILALLNGETVTLRDNDLVIADDRGPIALAGIMGGAATAVGPTTTDIVLESAFFAPEAIRGRARAHGLHTDSAQRFERGVDPALQTHAIERATALLQNLVGGRPGTALEVCSSSHLPTSPTITLRHARIAQVLGVTFAPATVTEFLTQLGMQATPTAAGWEVIPPSARFDLRHEIDLIAELGRVRGYDTIPVTRSCSLGVPQTLREGAFDLDQARARLVARGYREAITYSFVSAEQQRALLPETPVLTLANPLSAELATMRASLWPGLLQAARYNLARQQERVRLFESGLRFRLDDTGSLHQEPMLAGVLLGSALPEQWGEPARAVDFFDAKGDVEAMLALSGAADDFAFVPGAHPALHPGQSAQILRAGREVGWLGLLHPALATALDLARDGYLFELALTELHGHKPVFQPLSRFPTVRRDLAVTLADTVPYARVAATVRAAAGEELREVLLFDLYRGEKLDSGRKSLALGLILQASSRTLTDQDSERIVARVLARLVDDLGAQLRS